MPPTVFNKYAGQRTVGVDWCLSRVRRGRDFRVCLSGEPADTSKGERSLGRSVWGG